MASLRNRKRKLAKFLSLLLLAISSFGYCENISPVFPILNIIPKEDKEVLDDLFHLLFANGDFAYTFSGLKSMCSIDYTMYYARNISLNEKFTRETYLARKGFDTWKKYQHFFSMQGLRLYLEESNDYNEHFAFILINPDQCLQIIKKYINLFEKYYEEKFTPQQYLDLLCNGSFFQKGKNDPIILGLLLGYPEEDVAIFNQKIMLDKTLSSLPYDTQNKKFTSSLTFSTQELGNFLESKKNEISSIQLEKIKKELKPCSLSLNKNPLKPITTPYFMSNRTEGELKEIKSKYEVRKADLIEFYYSPDFLEKILERFL